MQHSLNSELVVRKINPMEIYNFCGILFQASHSFAENEEPLWDYDQIAPHAILGKYRLNELYLGFIDDIPVSAMILHHNRSSSYKDFLAVDKLAVLRTYSGQNLCLAMLNWANQFALQNHYQNLALNCECEHPRLAEHLSQFGFEEAKNLDFLSSRVFVQAVTEGQATQSLSLAL